MQWLVIAGMGWKLWALLALGFMNLCATLALLAMSRGGRMSQVTDALDNLEREVGETEGAEDSVLTLLTGIKAQLAAALESGGDQTAIITRIQVLTDELDKRQAILAAATQPAPAPDPAPDEPPTS